MGFFDWLRRKNDEPAAAPSASAAAPALAPAAPAAPKEEWEPVPAFLPVDAAEHRTVVVAATAIAASHPRFIPVSLPAVLSYTVCREGLTHSRGRRKKTETGYISLFSRTSQ